MKFPKLKSNFLYKHRVKINKAWKIMTSKSSGQFYFWVGLITMILGALKGFSSGSILFSTLLIVAGVVIKNKGDDEIKKDN